MDFSEMKGRQISDVTRVQIVISFADNKGYALPLTQVQSEVLLNTLGFDIDAETGELVCATDEELQKEKENAL